jgi:hypothetical protein
MALAALAIPVAIHLLGRQRARRVALPTARFADAAHQEARGRLWLKRLSLLALRSAATALVVLAVARPVLMSAQPSEAGPAAASPQPSPEARPASPPDVTPTPKRPIRVLVVDAAEETHARVRTADLVAAALGGDPEAKTVTRGRVLDLAGATLKAADVVFWTGSGTPNDEFGYRTFLEQCRLVWIPHAAESAQEVKETWQARVRGFGGFAPMPAERLDETPDGVTLDPADYTSDLLAAFEHGTSGDLGAPVLRRRLIPRDSGAACDRVAVRFRDGTPAIIESRDGKSRKVYLMFGPAPYWGDLAGRVEFVVLMHSLAEALAQDSTAWVQSIRPALPPTPPCRGRAAPANETSPALIDLSAWFVLGLAAALAGETALAASHSSARRPNPQLPG